MVGIAEPAISLLDAKPSFESVIPLLRPGGPQMMCEKVLTFLCGTSPDGVVVLDGILHYRSL